MSVGHNDANLQKAISYQTTSMNCAQAVGFGGAGGYLEMNVYKLSLGVVST
jgi:hypothetical protein